MELASPAVFPSTVTFKSQSFSLTLVGILVGSEVGILVGGEVGILVGGEMGMLVGDEVGLLVGACCGKEIVITICANKNFED